MRIETDTGENTRSRTKGDIVYLRSGVVSALSNVINAERV